MHLWQTIESRTAYMIAPKKNNHDAKLAKNSNYKAVSARMRLWLNVRLLAYREFFKAEKCPKVLIVSEDTLPLQPVRGISSSG